MLIKIWKSYQILVSKTLEELEEVHRLDMVGILTKHLAGVLVDLFHLLETLWEGVDGVRCAYVELVDIAVKDQNVLYPFLRCQKEQFTNRTHGGTWLKIKKKKMREKEDD